MFFTLLNILILSDAVHSLPLSDPSDHLASSILSAVGRYSRGRTFNPDGTRIQSNHSRELNRRFIVPLTSQLNVIYTTTLKIGDFEGQYQIDTGSADLWTTAFDCKACSTKGNYNSATSPTYSSTGERATLGYETSSSRGVFATETVSISGFTLLQQSFVNADQSTGMLNLHASGVLGLGFSAVTWDNSPSFQENLLSSTSMIHKFFGIYISRSDTAAVSTLSFGEMDFTHSYGYAYNPTPVIEQTYWIVNSTATFLNNNRIPSPSLAVSIDSGTNLIVLPKNMVKALFANSSARLNPTLSTAYGVDVYSYPCKSPPQVSFSFDGSANRYSVDPEDMRFVRVDSTHCAAAIIGRDFTSPYGQTLGVLGASFLKSWYATFATNSDGSASVGFTASRVAKWKPWAPVVCPSSSYAYNYMLNSCFYRPPRAN